MRPSRSDWIALARKYRTLAELRRAQHDASPDEVRGPLRGLSREFPGALRELDMLPLEVIEERARVLGRAASGGTIEPWMEWMHAFHLVLRSALGMKRALGGRREVAPEVAEAIAAELGREANLDAGFVRRVASPPAGRVTLVVLERLEAAFRTDASEIQATLFPR